MFIYEGVYRNKICTKVHWDLYDFIIELSYHALVGAFIGAYVNSRKLYLFHLDCSHVIDPNSTYPLAPAYCVINGI